MTININSKSPQDAIDKMTRWGYVYGEDFTLSCQSVLQESVFP